MTWAISGFVVGLCHVLLLAYAATGVGHGHGAPIEAAVWFGPGAFTWPIGPPFQYALYAYVAQRRLHALGWWLDTLHYAGAAGVLLFQHGRGALDLSSYAGRWPDLLWMFGPFAIFNVVYMRRLLPR